MVTQLEQRVAGSNHLASVNPVFTYTFDTCHCSAVGSLALSHWHMRRGEPSTRRG